MSGIYIPGMEMPKDCNHCRFAVDGWCYAYGKPNIDALENDGRTNFCPLFPVPDHGRLIDADVKEKDGWYLERHVRKADGYWIEIMPLKDAPTVIPADPDKDGT